MPTVVPLSDSRASRSSAVMTSAAPASASRRSAIGVAPACVAAPCRISRRSCGAAIAVTTPIGSPCVEHRSLLDVQLDERMHGRGIEPRLGDPRRIEARRRRASASETPSRSRIASSASGPSAPTSARLPMHPVPKRGSSPATAITSRLPARREARVAQQRTASIAPSTPTTPS